MLGCIHPQSPYVVGPPEYHFFLIGNTRVPIIIQDDVAGKYGTSAKSGSLGLGTHASGESCSLLSQQHFTNWNTVLYVNNNITLMKLLRRKVTRGSPGKRKGSHQVNLDNLYLLFSPWLVARDIKLQMTPSS